MDKLSFSKGWNIALWVLQVILAGMFAMAGITKATKSITEIVTMMPWAEAVPIQMIRIIGISEILAAIGLLLPSILKIKPILTPIAAAALVLVMTTAIFFHITRGEFNAVGFNIALGGLAAIVSWGRFRKAPLLAR